MIEPVLFVSLAQRVSEFVKSFLQVRARGPLLKEVRRVRTHVHSAVRIIRLYGNVGRVGIRVPTFSDDRQRFFLRLGVDNGVRRLRRFLLVKVHVGQKAFQISADKIIVVHSECIQMQDLVLVVPADDECETPMQTSMYGNDLERQSRCGCERSSSNF